MQTTFPLGFISSVRPCQLIKKVVLLALYVWIVWALQVHAEVPRAVGQDELAVYKELQQIKLDALKDSQQKDVEAWKARAESLDKRVDDFNNLTGWCGILVTALLVLTSYMTYRNAKSDAKSEAKATALVFLHKEIASAEPVKEILRSLKNSNSLSKELLESTGSIKKQSQQLLKDILTSKQIINSFSGEVMLAQCLIYREHKVCFHLFLQKALEFFNLCIDGPDLPTGTTLGNRAYVHWLLEDSVKAKEDYMRGLRSANNGGQKLYESTLERLNKKAIPYKDEGMIQLVEELWLSYTIEQKVL